jgi:hypothetical protein
MARISAETRVRNEQAVRSAMDRLLKGELPPGGSTDLKTLAAEAGVTRTRSIRRRTVTAPPAPGPTSTLPRSSSGASRLCRRPARSSTHGPRRSNGSRPRSPNSGNGAPSGTKPCPG